MTEPGTASVFASRDYCIFTLARSCANLSLRMLQVAIGWQIYDLTGEAIALGYVSLALFLPQVILILPAGDMADRYDRRVLIAAATATCAAGALLLAALTFADSRELIFYYLAFGIVGVGQTFTRPAERSYLPFLVPRHLLASAVSWSSSITQTTTVVGPAAGGALYLFGPLVVYVIGAGLFLAATVSILFIRTRIVAASTQGTSGWTRFREGVSYIRRQRIVLGAITLDLFAVLLGGSVVLLPIFAKDILMTGPEGLGVLRSAPAVGGVITAAVLAQLTTIRNAGSIMFAGVAAFGVTTILFGLSTDFFLSLVVLALLGAADTVAANIRSTMTQLAVPDDMRGRVSAVDRLFIGASNELGDFESSLVAAAVGAVPAVIIGGVGTLAVVAVWMWAFPELRRVDRVTDVRPL